MKLCAKSYKHSFNVSATIYSSFSYFLSFLSQKSNNFTKHKI